MAEDKIVRRRAAVQQEDALLSDKEVARLEAAEQAETQRLNRKAERLAELERDSVTFNIAKNLKKYLDDYYLDPLIGLIPVVGDSINGLIALPMLWLALVRLKSIPLALAIIYNLTLDFLLGLIPFFIGDLIDLFNKANKKNYRLVMGFVEEDKKIMREVNQKAVGSAIGIAVICWIIYLVASWISELTQTILNAIQTA